MEPKKYAVMDCLNFSLQEITCLTVIRDNRDGKFIFYELKHFLLGRNHALDYRFERRLR